MQRFGDGFENDNMKIDGDMATAMRTGKSVAEVKAAREKAEMEARLANHPPQAKDGQEVVTKNTPKIIDFRAFVFDADQGDKITPMLVSQPKHGTLTQNADGTYRYTPKPGFTGEDVIRYMASDGYSQSSVATLTVKVEVSMWEGIYATLVPLTTAAETMVTTAAQVARIFQWVEVGAVVGKQLNHMAKEWMARPPAVVETHAAPPPPPPTSSSEPLPKKTSLKAEGGQVKAGITGYQAVIDQHLNPEDLTKGMDQVILEGQSAVRFGRYIDITKDLKGWFADQLKKTSDMDLIRENARRELTTAATNAEMRDVAATGFIQHEMKGIETLIEERAAIGIQQVHSQMRQWGTPQPAELLAQAPAVRTTEVAATPPQAIDMGQLGPQLVQVVGIMAANEIVQSDWAAENILNQHMLVDLSVRGLVMGLNLWSIAGAAKSIYHHVQEGHWTLLAIEGAATVGIEAAILWWHSGDSDTSNHPQITNE